MIINPNNRNTRRPIYLDDGLLHQISVIDCILMRLRLNRLSCWRDNLKLCTKYRLRIISAFQNSYAFNYWYLEWIESASYYLIMWQWHVCVPCILYSQLIIRVVLEPADCIDK